MDHQRSARFQHASRALQEIFAAEAAIHPRTRAAHRELARLHLDLAAQAAGPSGRSA
jgi:hypothetical protein